MKNLNSKVLLITLLVAGTIAAVLVIGQMWFDFLAWELFIKVLVTILIISTLAGFLIAVDYDAPASKDKTVLGLMVSFALTMAALTIAQLWWLALEWILFAKLFGTVLILFALVSFFIAIKEDFGGNKRLKDEDYLD